MEIMTTLGWKCHTRAAPSCDIFNLGSSYFHVPLTTVRHLLNVCYRPIHLRLYSCSVAYAKRYSWHPDLTTSIVYTLTKSTVMSKCHRVVIGLLPIGLCVVLMITEDYMFTLSVGLKTKIDFGSHWWRGSQLPPPNYPPPPRPLGLALPCLFTFTSLCKRFFQRIIKDKSNVLFYLLPAKRDVQLTTRLRCSRQYPTIYARTNRYKNSFILFGLNHFQRCDFVYAWFFEAARIQ